MGGYAESFRFSSSGLQRVGVAWKIAAQVVFGLPGVRHVARFLDDSAQRSRNAVRDRWMYPLLACIGPFFLLSSWKSATMTAESDSQGS